MAATTLFKSAADHGTGRLDLRGLLYPASGLSLLAAMGHLWAMPQHFEEWVGYGLFFLLAAFLQGAYALVLLRWPRPPVLLAGIAGNLGMVGFYIGSRTAGIPLLGPHAGHVESAAAVDLTVTVAELALVGTLVVLARALHAARTYVVLGAVQAFGVGALLHLMHGGLHASVGASPVQHWLSSSILALPLSVLVVWLATPPARRLVRFFGGETGSAPSRLAWSLVTAGAYAATSVPANGLAVQHAEAGPFLAQALRDAGVVLGATFLLLFAISMLRGAPWEEKLEKINLWRPRAIAATAGIAAALALVAGPTVFGQSLSKMATAQQAPAAAADCSAASYDRSYDVAAINLDIPFNRWGDMDRDGQAFVLQGDKDAMKNWHVELGDTAATDPAGADNRRLRPRPLVIRANAGECVKVDLTNELNDRQWGGELMNPRVSMQVRGPSYDVQTSDGGAVGFNDDTTVSNKTGQNKITYYWKAPEDEGNYLFRSQTMNSGQEEDAGSVAHGLYGALAVEPAGSTWTDPETGKPVYAGEKDHKRITKQSGDPYIDADINPPAGTSFRESVQLAQDYSEVSEGEVGHGFNYGTEPNRHRIPANPAGDGTVPEQLAPDGVGEEVSLSSWAYGDPALVKLADGQGPWKPTPGNKDVEDCGLEEQPGGSCYVSNVTHAYKGDPTKIRYTMAGVAETHVFHMHAHQWLANPKETKTFDPKNPSSATLDSQTFGPGESFTADLIGGAGSTPGTFGDSIFHCHLYPHFAEGFWSLFRVHDVKETGDPIAGVPGSGQTPDGVNVRNLEPLQDRTAPEEPTADNPGYPRFMPGEFGWRAPQPPGSISEPDPTTADPDDKRPATRTVAGKALDPEQLDAADPLEAGLEKKLELEKKVQTLNAGPNPNPGAPFSEPCPSGSREVTYNVSAIQTDIVYNERGDHDTQGRMLVLDKDVDAILSGQKKPEPLFVRLNAGDCIDFNLTNRLPNWIGNDAFVELAQTNMFGQHIHLVKFDVLASDGASNGWNYQQAAFSNEQMKFEDEVISGGQPCSRAEGCRIDEEPANWDPATQTQAGAEPGQTISERWYADYELKTVFGHDHHFAALDQNRGLFNGLLVEPEGMDSRNPKTGEFYQPINDPANGTPCGDSCEGEAVGSVMDIIGPGPNDDFREFGLAFQDFVSLTEEGGNPQSKADTIVPPTAPEEYPDEDPGVVGINYRNAPFQLRQERDGVKTDPAHTFSSTVHGDPQTPVLEAYAEDPVSVRLIQGAQEHQHTFEMNGMRWNEDGEDQNSPLVGSQAVGISEAFNFQLPKMECGAGSSDCSGDYLYGSPNVDDMYMGMWGLLRARGEEVPSLLPLPDNVPATETTEERAPSANAPPQAASPGTPCAPGAPTKQYSVVAMEQELKYNEHGDHDPSGLMYALAEDEAAIKAGNEKPEPLVLRANQGDCIEVKLTNKISQSWLDDHPNAGTDGDAMQPSEPETGTPAGLRVSLHPQLVKYDVRGSDGTAVGYNRDQTVGSGESRVYRWYADEEVGATNLTDFGDLRGHRHHGLFAGLNIEPRGSTYHDPVTGEEIKSGVSADIRVPGPDNDFREFTTFFQDGLNLRDASGAPIAPPAEPHADEGGLLDAVLPGGEAHDHIDQGEKGFNYGSEPFRHRIGMEATDATPTNPVDGQKLSDVYNSKIHGDPATPVFRAYAGDDVKVRVMQGADKQRQNAYQLAGHSWRSFPGDEGSPMISTEGGFSVGRAINVELPSAGNGFAGDYRYNDGMYRHHLSGGMWGLMRVYPQPTGNPLQPTPLSNTQPDNPRAGGHPILPLEISAATTSLDLKADPAALDPGKTTTLSGKLASGGISLSNKEVVLERSPAGANQWKALPDGKLTTNADGAFSLADVEPDGNTDYRARFAGQSGIGLKASTSSVINVKVKQAASLSLRAGPATVTVGKAATLSGKLTAGEEALADRRVILLHKPAGAAKFTKLPGQPAAGVLTAADGGYRLTGVKPEKNTAYRARYAGGAESQSSVSAIKRVNVRPVVTNSTSKKQMKVNRNRIISGMVKPAHTGTVKVEIKKGKKVMLTRNVKLNDSRYRMVYKPKTPGVYAVRATVSKNADHLAGASPTKKFKVTR